MKRTLLILLLFLGTNAIAQTATFGPTDVTTGTSWIETARYTTNVPALTVGDQTTPAISRVVNRVKSVTVNSIGANGRIERVTVQYTSATTNGNSLGVEGKTFIITVSGNNATVTPSGFSATPEQIAFVEADNAHFRQFFACEKIFHRAQEFTVGVAEPIRAFADDLVNTTDGVDVDSMTIELTGVDEETNVATFDVVSHLSTAAKKGRGKIPATEPGGLGFVLNGTMQVAVANSRILLLDLGGTISVTPRKANGEAFSGGTGSASFRVEYTP